MAAFPKLVLAPLAGFTNAAFRRVCARRGADLTYTEMVSAAALAHDSRPTRLLLDVLPGEGPVACQLFGAKPEELQFAAAEVDKLGRFVAIDLNAGCPMPNIVHEGAGAALIRDPAKVYDCLRAIRAATSLPVTLKTRPGPRPDRIVLWELLDAAARAGCAGITLHGRFTSQMHGGPVDYDLIAELVARAKIPVTGNGHVYNHETFARMMETGVSAVMLARGALANPWLFTALRGPASDASDAPDPAVRRAAQRAAFEEHLAALLELRALSAAAHPEVRVPDPDGFVSVALHTHLFRYFNGLPGAAALRGRLNTIRTLAETQALASAWNEEGK